MRTWCGRRVTVGLLAGALMLASCGSTDESEAPEQASEPGDEPQAEEGAASARDDPPSDDTDAGEDAAVAADAPCSAEDTNLQPEPPENAQDVRQAAGDLLGDGRTDQVLTYAVDTGDDRSHWLRLVTDTGYVVELPLDDASSMAPVQPLGITSIGADREVAFVVEGSGTAGVNVGLWALHDASGPCQPARVSLPDHTAGPTFHVGATQQRASGLTCGDVHGDGRPELVVTEAERADGDGYDWRQSAWHWPGGGELQFVEDDQGTVDDLDELEGLELDCPTVETP